MKKFLGNVVLAAVSVVVCVALAELATRMIDGLPWFCSRSPSGRRRPKAPIRRPTISAICRAPMAPPARSSPAIHRALLEPHQGAQGMVRPRKGDRERYGDRRGARPTIPSRTGTCSRPGTRCSSATTSASTSTSRGRRAALDLRSARRQGAASLRAICPTPRRRAASSLTSSAGAGRRCRIAPFAQDRSHRLRRRVDDGRGPRLSLFRRRIYRQLAEPAGRRRRSSTSSSRS